jgi:hypothetical protein
VVFVLTSIYLYIDFYSEPIIPSLDNFVPKSDFIQNVLFIKSYPSIMGITIPFDGFSPFFLIEVLLLIVTPFLDFSPITLAVIL